MAKGPESATGRLSALVAKIEAEAYARGRADARKEILRVLGATGKPAPRPRRGSPRAARPARKPPANGGKRAPKGSARALIERALRDRPGLAAREVHSSTESNTSAPRLGAPAHAKTVGFPFARNVGFSFAIDSLRESDSAMTGIRRSTR